MTPSTDHVGDDLHLLVDGRLSDRDRERVDAHVSSCATCKAELADLRDLKARLRQHSALSPVPAAVRARVAQTIDQVDAEARRAPTSPRRAPGRRVAIALAAAAVVIFIVMRPSPPDFVAGADGDLVAYMAGTLALTLETSEPAALEAHLASAAFDFPTRVFDFGMMGYALVGGQAGELEGRSSALFAYEGQNGEDLVCQMFEATSDELPSGFEVRENLGVVFRIYRRDGRTLVFWQEGDVLCVLASTGDPEEAIQLAFAKAVPGGTPEAIG
ncbi:MAG: hypothetical protein FJ207_08030 [Gemmatimonadetes bacterium]|nr:hypothetical protein [Gemmatimonadota bacterium]